MNIGGSAPTLECINALDKFLKCVQDTHACVAWVVCVPTCGPGSLAHPPFKPSSAIAPSPPNHSHVCNRLPHVRHLPARFVSPSHHHVLSLSLPYLVPYLYLLYLTSGGENSLVQFPSDAATLPTPLLSWSLAAIMHRRGWRCC